MAVKNEFGAYADWVRVYSWAEGSLGDDTDSTYAAAFVGHVKKHGMNEPQQMGLFVFRKPNNRSYDEYTLFSRSPFWQRNPLTDSSTASDVTIDKKYMWYHTTRAFWDEDILRIKRFQFRLKAGKLFLIGHTLEDAKSKESELESFAGCGINYSVHLRIDWKRVAGRYSERRQKMVPASPIGIENFTDRSKHESPDGLDPELLCSEPPRFF